LGEISNIDFWLRLSNIGFWLSSDDYPNNLIG
jgi:hypothetical protein